MVATGNSGEQIGEIGRDTRADQDAMRHEGAQQHDHSGSHRAGRLSRRFDPRKILPEGNTSTKVAVRVGLNIVPAVVSRVGSVVPRCFQWLPSLSQRERVGVREKRRCFPRSLICPTLSPSPCPSPSREMRSAPFLMLETPDAIETLRLRASSRVVIREGRTYRRGRHIIGNRLPRAGGNVLAVFDRIIAARS